MIKKPKKYSVFSLVRNALSYHENWQPAWRNPEIKKNYDAIIVGGGGHGLTTAYYLAKEHKITNIAVIEKGWIGGGNIGRNTTIIRSNFMYDDNARFNEFGMNLWRNMSQELNFNVMFSPRGIINLAHSDAQMNIYSRRGNSMRLNGFIRKRRSKKNNSNGRFFRKCSFSNFWCIDATKCRHCKT